MSVFLDYIDNLINHPIIDNNFQLYARNELHHFIHDFIFCIFGSAFTESFDF